MTIRPSDVPRLRDRLLECVRSPVLLPAVLDLSLSGKHWPAQWSTAQYLARLARWLEMAELFYITQDMTALTVAAGAGLPHYDLRPEMMPAEVGLMMWGAVACRVDNDTSDDPTMLPGEACEIRAALWAPVTTHAGERKLLVVSWQDTEVMIGTRDYGPEEGEFSRRNTGPLAYHEEYPLPWGTTAINTPNAFARVCQATWTLMGQRVTQEERVEPDRATRRRAQREGRTAPAVRLVTLRRTTARPRPQPDPAKPARTYTHRWPVSGYGYWRNTWYPSEQAHHLQFVYVPTYIKGDPDLPLVVGQRVNVLRR